MYAKNEWKIIEGRNDSPKLVVLSTGKYLVTTLLSYKTADDYYGYIVKTVKENE